MGLDGSGSSDPEGEDLSYQWTAPAGVTLSSATAERPNFTAPVQLVTDRPLTFSLVVTDERGAASAPDTVVITTTAGGNDPPIADAGPNQTVDEGAIVGLDGSGSSDPEGEDLSYQWTAPAGVTLSSATAERPNFTAPVQLVTDRPLTFSLVVTDERGAASAPDTVVITTTAGGNDPPIADAGPNQTVDEGAIVGLDGSGSSDPEGEDLSYQWTAPAGVTLSSATAERPNFTAPVQLVTDRPLTFSLVVTDERGAASAPDTVVITTTAGGNDPPIADAGPNQTVDEGAIVGLDGSGSSDPEGEDLSYQWTAPAGVTLSSATAERPNFTAPVQLVTDRPLTFSLVVTDERGAASAPDTVVITTTAGGNDPPIADAGPNQTVDEGAIVGLDGSGSSDPEGEDLSYQWTAPAGVTLSSATAERPNFTAPVQLVTDRPLTFSLVVTDERGAASAPDTVVITTTAGGNDPPIADAGPNQTVDEGAIVGLDGSNSFDPEGEDLSYQWTAPAGVTLSSATAERPNFTAPVQLVTDRPLTFSLVVTDERGAASAPDTVVITTTAGGNDPPIADAGPNQTVDEGAIVGLDGSNSFDPEGEDLSYQWTAPAGVTLSSATAERPNFTAPVQLVTDRPLTFSLVVTDERGAASAPDTVVITTTAGGNDPPIADAGPNQTVDEGAIVGLDGSNSFDPEGEDLSYQWTAPAGVTLSSATAERPNFTAPVQLVTDRPLTFSLVVTDERGAASAPDTVVITTTAGGNDPPIADAGPNQTVDEGAIVGLDGSNSFDPEGEDLSYQWTAPAGVTLSSATAERPNFTAPVQLVTDRPLTFSLVVTDERGAASAPDTVVITTTAGGNDPPIADAGPNQTVDEGAIVGLDGSNSSDPEGEDLSYQWTAPAGVTLSSATAERPNFTAPVQLVTDRPLTFSLVVTDERGAASAPDTVVITVGAIRRLTISADRTKVTEGEDVRCTVTRTGDIGSALTVPLMMSGGENFVTGPLPAFATFEVGLSTAVPVVVSTVDDTVDEPDDTIMAALLPLEGYELGDAASVRILDNDASAPDPEVPSILIEPRRLGAASALRRHVNKFSSATSSAVHHCLNRQTTGRLSLSQKGKGGDVLAGGCFDEGHWGAWFNGSYADFGGNSEGSQIELYSGICYSPNENSVIGGLVGLEFPDLEIGAANYSAHFVHLGAYGGMRLEDRLIFDGAVAFGFANPEIELGEVSADYSARRFTIRGDLTGDFGIQSDTVTIAPRVGVLYARERLGGFTDNKGGVASSDSIEIGRTILGLRAIWDFERSQLIAGIQGQWDFIELDDNVDGNFSGAVEVGRRFDVTSDINLGIFGNVDGIGIADDFVTYSGRIEIGIKF